MQIEEIKTFTFKPELLNLMKTALAPAMKEIKKELAKEGIVIYLYEVDPRSKYTAMGDMHTAYMIVTGTYAKK